MPKQSKLERAFATVYHQLADTLPMPVAEYPFHPTRRWRVDFAFPPYKVAVEIEGGVWSGGRHTRPKGFLGDLQKYNELSAMGWRLLRFTREDIYNDPVAMIDTIRRTLELAHE